MELAKPLLWIAGERAGAVTGSVNVCKLSEILTSYPSFDSGAECSNYGIHSQ